MPLYVIQLGKVDPLESIEASSLEEAKQLYMDMFGILGTKNAFLQDELFVEPEPESEPEAPGLAMSLPIKDIPNPAKDDESKDEPDEPDEPDED